MSRISRSAGFAKADELDFEKSGLEKLFVQLSLEHYEKELQKEGKVIEEWMRAEHIKWSKRALRCTILWHLLGESFRGMSMGLAECQMFQLFCKLDDFEKMHIPSRSTLHNYEHWLSQEQIIFVLEKLTVALSDEEKAEKMRLEVALKMEVAYMDTTCLEANIHFPTDWGF